VGIGLVKSLAHPGGNVTGISSIAESLTPKRIELLRQILPGVKRLGMLGDSNDPVTRLNGSFARTPGTGGTSQERPFILVFIWLASKLSRAHLPAPLDL